MKKAFIILFVYLSMILVFNALLNIILLPTSPAKITFADADTASACAMCLVFSLIISVIYLCLRSFSRQPLKGCFVLPTAGVAILALAGLVLTDCISSAMINLASIPSIMPTGGPGLTKTPIGIITLCVIVPVAGVLTFQRGIMGSLLESKVFHKYALILSSLILGISNVDPQQAVSAFTAGLFLGWLYLRTHSMILPILCFMLSNASSIMQDYIYSAHPALGNFMNSTTVNITTLAVSCVLLVPVLLVLNKKLSNKKMSCTTECKEY